MKNTLTVTLENRLRFTLDKGTFKGRTLEFWPRVCNNPLCTCQDLDVYARMPSDVDPGEHESWLARFRIDVGKRTLDQERQAPDTVAASIVEGLADSDWDGFGKWWQLTKWDQLERADLAKLNAEFPEEVFREGLTVGFGEIFPHFGAIPFELNGAEWVIQDSYCVQPGCPCKDAHLVFIPLNKNTPEDQVVDLEVSRVPKAHYGYVSRSFEAEESEDPAHPRVRALVAALQSGRPQLGADLAKRHRQLRALFRGALERRNPTPRSPRAGRNELCPCGSGKKFKRCCGQ